MLTIRNLCLLFCVGIAAITTAQNDLAEKAYRAYLNNDADLWASVVNDYEQGSDSDRYLRAAEAAYGAAGTAFANEDEGQAKKWAQRSVELAKKHLETDSKSADGKAVLAGAYGIQMGLSPMKAMFLGGKSKRLLHEAVDSENAGPLPHFMMAMSFYQTPAMFGGDNEKAVAHFKKAVSGYKAESRAHDWMYLSSMAWLGQALESQEQNNQAIAVYEQALETEPGFFWVKYELLPAVK